MGCYNKRDFILRIYSKLRLIIPLIKNVGGVRKHYKPHVGVNKEL